MDTVREAVRRLRRSPGYVAAFVVTLGLAIGVNSAVFAVVNAVLLRPLPFEAAERIVYLQQPVDGAGVTNTLFSFHEVADYRAGMASFDEVVEFGDWTFSVVPDDGGEPHRAIGGLVTSNYFHVLGFAPAVGRALQPDDDAEGAEPVMVLTDHYWIRAWGGDPTVLGRLVELNGKPTRIVGILEPGTHYTGSRRQDFYVNYATNDHYLGASMQDSRTHRMTDVFARLAPGTTVETARAEATALSEELHRRYPEAYPARLAFGLTVDRWQDQLTREARPVFLLLMGTVAAVLLLACANLANLSLTRLVRREGELATRGALGATPGSLRRMLATENLLLAGAGGGLGLLLAWASGGLLSSYAARFTVRAEEVGLDLTVFLATLAVAAVVAVALAFLPLKSLDPRGRNFSVAGGRSTGTQARKRTQAALVVTQLALSFTLLAAAGLMVRSLLALQSRDPGFETENVLTLQAFQSFANASADVSNEELFTRLEHEVGDFPGVRAVGVSTFAPLTGGNRMAWNVRVEGGEGDGEHSITMAMNNVTPGYFRALDLQLVSGRLLEHMDRSETEPVAVVSRSLARAAFGSADAVGRRIATSFDGSNWGEPVRIVGVVEDSRQFGLTEAATPTLYRPALQTNFGQTVLLATRGDPLVLVDAVKAAIRRIDATRPVDQIRTMEDLLAEDTAPARLNAVLFGVFAVLALTIAAVGVLGVLAFSVSQRTREFGLRMAVGADRATVLGSVMREGARLVALALAVGAAGAYAVSRLLGRLLVGIEPSDPLSFGAAGLVLATVSLIAAFIPARRATRVDPIQALRHD